MCEMYFPLVYKILEYVDLKERNRKQIFDQLKRKYNSQRRKFTALFKIKKFNLKNKLLKKDICTNFGGYWMRDQNMTEKILIQTAGCFK